MMPDVMPDVMLSATHLREQNVTPTPSACGKMPNNNLLLLLHLTDCHWQPWLAWHYQTVLQ
jgi:hypothetical protein